MSLLVFLLSTCTTKLSLYVQVHGHLVSQTLLGCGGGIPSAFCILYLNKMLGVYVWRSFCLIVYHWYQL